jgi:hypothetical protein
MLTQEDNWAVYLTRQAQFRALPKIGSNFYYTILVGKAARKFERVEKLVKNEL